MFNFFEQPWTLLVTAVVALYIVFRIRGIFPKKHHWWQWLIPVFIAVAAFGLEYLVETDLEKIEGVIKTGIKAFEEENTDVIETLISADYRDSYHDSKERLMSHCKRAMSQNPAEEGEKKNWYWNLAENEAKVVLLVQVKFDKDSFVTQNYRQTITAEVDVILQKQPDNNWLISRIELRKLDMQSVNWQQIRY